MWWLAYSFLIVKTNSSMFHMIRCNIDLYVLILDFRYKWLACSWICIDVVPVSRMYEWVLFTWRWKIWSGKGGSNSDGTTVPDFIFRNTPFPGGPLKLEKTWFFWHKIAIFHKKYPKNAPPPNLKSWIRPCIFRLWYVINSNMTSFKRWSLNPW